MSNQGQLTVIQCSEHLNCLHLNCLHITIKKYMRISELLTVHSAECKCKNIAWLNEYM